MTDFDKLIKEKVEGATYPYDSSAWKQFRKKSGMGHSSLKYWVAGVSTALVAGGVSVFLLLNHSSKPTLISPEEQSVVVDDTLSQVTKATEEHLQADTFMVIPGKTTTTLKKSSPTSGSELHDPADSKTSVPASKPAQTVVRYGKPLVIDVDTIKDNVPSDEQLKEGHSRLY